MNIFFYVCVSYILPVLLRLSPLCRYCILLRRLTVILNTFHCKFFVVLWSGLKRLNFHCVSTAAAMSSVFLSAPKKKKTSPNVFVSDCMRSSTGNVGSRRVRTPTRSRARVAAPVSRHQAAPPARRTSLRRRSEPVWRISGRETPSRRGSKSGTRRRPEKSPKSQVRWLY